MCQRSLLVREKGAHCGPVDAPDNDCGLPANTSPEDLLPPPDGDWYNGINTNITDYQGTRTQGIQDKLDANEPNPGEAALCVDNIFSEIRWKYTKSYEWQL